MNISKVIASTFFTAAFTCTAEASPNSPSCMSHAPSATIFPISVLSSGTYSTTESLNGRTLDTSGYFQRQIEFENLVELARTILGSSEPYIFHVCFNPVTGLYTFTEVQRTGIVITGSTFRRTLVLIATQGEIYISDTGRNLFPILDGTFCGGPRVCIHDNITYLKEYRYSLLTKQLFLRHWTHRYSDYSNPETGAHSGSGTAIDTGETQVALHQGCVVAPITRPLPDDALRHEAFSSTPAGPPESLVPPQLDAALNVNALLFEAAVRSRLPDIRIFRSSGFRPVNYQNHLVEIKDKFEELKVAKHTPGQTELCLEIERTILDEITQHGLVNSANTPIVAINDSTLPPIVARVSSHSREPAVVLDYGGIRSLSSTLRTRVFQIAAESGLSRPDLTDIVHFGAEYRATLVAGVESPMTIKVIDPSGKSVGYDTQRGIMINDFGSRLAFYSGPSAGNQYVEIGDAQEGTYTIEGTGVDEGPFTLYFKLLSEDGAVLKQSSLSGTVRSGQKYSLQFQPDKVVHIDVQPQSVNSALSENSQGHIAVAVISQANFDATSQIDASSLRFGKTGIEQSMDSCTARDVNGDGLLDLVCKFLAGKTNLDSTDNQAVLTGLDIRRYPLRGVDWVKVLPSAK